MVWSAGGGGGLLPKKEVVFSVSLHFAQALLVTLWSTVIIYSTQTLKWAWQADSFLKQSNSQNFQVYAPVWENISAKIRISSWVSCLFCPDNSLLPSIIHHSETIRERKYNTLYIILSKERGRFLWLLIFFRSLLGLSFCNEEYFLLKRGKIF